MESVCSVSKDLVKLSEQLFQCLKAGSEIDRYRKLINTNIYLIKKAIASSTDKNIGNLSQLEFNLAVLENLRCIAEQKKTKNKKKPHLKWSGITSAFLRRIQTV
jgi:3-phosphoglycerate kinase